jgi:hypothetical protein
VADDRTLEDVYAALSPAEAMLDRKVDPTLSWVWRLNIGECSTRHIDIEI